MKLTAMNPFFLYHDPEILKVINIKSYLDDLIQGGSAFLSKKYIHIMLQRKLIIQTDSIA